MIDFDTRRSRVAWLEQQSYESCVALASRVALRVFPYCLISSERSDSHGNDLILFCERALLLSSVAAVLPSDSIKRAAEAFGLMIDNQTMSDDPDYSFAVASVYSAARSAQDIGTAYEAFAAISAPFGAFKYDSTDADEDALAIEDGLLAEGLMKTPLWRVDIMEQEWSVGHLILAANEVDQSFWIDWYQRILDGRPQNWKMLEEIALIDPEDWVKGAEHVNGLIAGIQARYAVKETVKAAQKVLAEYPVVTSRIGHNNPPDDIEDDPFAAEDAAFTQKMLDDIGEECESGEPDVSLVSAVSDGLGKVIRKIGVWLAGLAAVSLAAFSATLGKRAALKVEDPLFAYMAGLLEALQAVVESIGTWLPFIAG